jgi:transcriptional regulator with XRE-family HTH domain
MVYTLQAMGETVPEIDEEVRRYASLLRQAIRAAGLSVSEVERRLGAGPKALRRIFSGHVDLKLKHVLAILRILNMPQDEFFTIAAKPKRAVVRTVTSPADFLAAFQRIGYRGDFVPVDEVDPASPEEFDRLVEDAVNRVLERRTREAEALAGQGYALSAKGNAEPEP